MGSEYSHAPVLVKEVRDLLQPGSNENFFDGTVGGGGHAEVLLEATGPHGRLLGCDLDPRALRAARDRLSRFGNRATIVKGNYADCGSLVRNNPHTQPIQGMLIDLGLSSDQLDSSGRGFSFRDQGAADMRFDPDTELSAGDLLASASESELKEIFKKFGEVREASRLAHALVRYREGARDSKTRRRMTVPEIVELILRVIPSSSLRIHPATKIFQALRIAVNRELENLLLFLPQALAFCAPGGRIAVVSYHSLEDRIVKDFFRKESTNCLCPPETPVCRCGHTATLRLVTKHPIRPMPKEISENRRSRSAKLRVAQKIKK